MKKYPLFILLFMMALTGCSKEDGGPVDPVPEQEPKTNAEKLLEAEWEVKEVSEEITWKYGYFEDLFSSNQSITIFEVDLSDEDLSIGIPYVEDNFIATSDAAWMVGATAAINGSYFDTSKGGSTVFLKVDGNVVTPTRSGFTSYRENVAFGLDEAGEPLIVKKPSGGWESSGIPTLLASGPMLVADGEEVEQVDQPFTQNRHPRTAIGLTDDKRLITVVVDGRTSEAHGMSTIELAEVMEVLGCTVAMNLDGGGSSTAWIKNRGVVNYPSDNGKFDHDGERKVSTAIGFVIEE